MKTYKIEDMTRGWFVGDFIPTAHKTRECEVAYKTYNAGDKEDPHYHKVATEITVIIEGKVKMNNNFFSKGDVIVVYPNEIVAFEAIEDSSNVVVKVPGAVDDKYLV